VPSHRGETYLGAATWARPPTISDFLVAPLQMKAEIEPQDANTRSEGFVVWAHWPIYIGVGCPWRNARQAWGADGPESEEDRQTADTAGYGRLRHRRGELTRTT